MIFLILMIFLIASKIREIIKIKKITVQDLDCLCTFATQNQAMRKFFLLIFAIICLAAACNSGDSDREGDPLLAKAYNKKLYFSEIKWLVPAGTPAEDSVLMVKAYSQRWLNEQLLMYEAERNIPKDLNIDELVRDYRASLIRHNYEEQIIAERLDSTVAETELRKFYESNKEQFELESTILKCQILKVPMEAPQAELNKIWYSKDREKLKNFADRWATTSSLDTDKWHHLEEIAAFLPKGTLTADNVSSRREGTLSDDGFRFYYRILETVRGKETAPFEFAKESARTLILHQKKQEILEKFKDELFSKAKRQDNLKIY